MPRSAPAARCASCLQGPIPGYAPETLAPFLSFSASKALPQRWHRAAKLISAEAKSAIAASVQHQLWSGVQVTRVRSAASQGHQQAGLAHRQHACGCGKAHSASIALWQASTLLRQPRWMPLPGTPPLVTHLAPCDSCALHMKLVCAVSVVSRLSLPLFQPHASVHPSRNQTRLPAAAGITDLYLQTTCHAMHRVSTVSLVCRRESLGLPPERPVSPASSVRSTRSFDGDTSTSEETPDQVRVCSMPQADMSRGQLHAQPACGLQQ